MNENEQLSHDMRQFLLTLKCMVESVESQYLNHAERNKLIKVLIKHAWQPISWGTAREPFSWLLRGIIGFLEGALEDQLTHTDKKMFLRSVAILINARLELDKPGASRTIVQNGAVSDIPENQSSIPF